MAEIESAGDFAERLNLEIHYSPTGEGFLGAEAVELIRERDAAMRADERRTTLEDAAGRVMQLYGDFAAQVLLQVAEREAKDES